MNADTCIEYSISVKWKRDDEKMFHYGWIVKDYNGDLFKSEDNKYATKQESIVISKQEIINK